MQTASVAAAYDKWAPVYDLVFGGVFANGRKQAIVAAEQVGGRVLEVGVGTGISLPHYDKRTRLVGIDISEAMLDKARRRARELKLENVEEIAVGDAEALAYPDNAFDVVVAQYVVTAVPDPERALDEFVRVVRPGGEIVIATRISANGGLRDSIEKALMPITSRLGWRTEFPWSRYEAWAQRNGQVRLLEQRPLPPLGHFSLVRYRKLQG
ncbi:phosphatidylethanolamine/phosphatidyl-N-methylethanolamine N-methyltransferase [Novosphingobium chloroacetimidivorans]|uniref:Phosphatidylethanolamine/phosphatidyl-N-methylethanolamine N-methyltransferase n=1 Tax=Novosphingobium chloroacetimidivorans TaxID=1428314 RepID=A0A7W7KCW5_9SPHN|nr:methyltransferase domain-containing protein [Novosphingobium chloroacetimidivorans]MBB4860517.1 phosphatidylethanolamine/phosphatidyl-N-methylethanolamine N-methyltransferase [Novosphingobium chloroacetimidivorans]